MSFFFKKLVLRLTIRFKELNTFLKYTMHFKYFTYKSSWGSQSAKSS